MAAKSPAKKTPKPQEVSKVGDFKKRSGGLMELPSGLVAKLKNPGGLAAFAGTDTIPNSLMNIVSQSLDANSGKGVDQSKLVEQIKKDPETLNQMGNMLDSIALKTFVEPRLYPVPTDEALKVWNQEHPDNMLSHPEELRSDDRVYVDEVDTVDKQYIFQWITSGVADLERFRLERQQSLANVS